MIQPVEVVRDENGFFFHPELPNWDEGTTPEEFEQWRQANNVSLLTVSMENSYDDDFVEAWFNGEVNDCTPWQPFVDVANAFILTINDTEDGPCAVFAVPNV
ncbi:hypothetical protein [Motilimonas eburnea]|uniref:hypothetical protein n=1 Tax=Motilimonas eburnea TaxID=1737488 RepID=UPI001E3C2DAE|nr:hypothetical protein [Motilimonas eburnea]MCE2571660.1 hypothetical protein [Motilimonas eburnea]